jgi:integrase
MGKRGEYKPPKGYVGDNSSNILSTFDDPNVAWPKRSHWWHYVKENETFAMWLLNVAAGSHTTAIEQARSLARFLDIMGWKLDDLMSEASEDKSGLERRLELFARKLENQGYKRGTINNYFKAIKSWLRYNDVELTRRIKLSKTSSKREMVPSPENIALILRGANTRQAVCVSCVAYGGLRLGALPDLDLDSLEFVNLPSLVFVRRELSKIGLPYRTFIPESACYAISEYLKIRQEKIGEKLTEDSPLIAVEEGWVARGFRMNTGNRHVRSKTISQDIRTAIGGIGKWRPYDLRHYFLTWLNLAVARGACSEGYRIHWAGQRGKTADIYDLYKDDIPSAIIEDMREQYRQAQEFLLPKKSNSGEERRRKQSLIDFALVQGWSEDKIQRLKEVMTRPISFEDGMKAFRRMEENLERPRTSL